MIRSVLFNATRWVSFGWLLTAFSYAGSVPMEAEGLRTLLSLDRASLVVGEPLVATLLITNAGQSKIQTPYASSQTLRYAAHMGFQILKDKDVVLTPSGGGSGAKVVMRTGVGIEPGGTVKARKVVVMGARSLQSSQQFLPPGTYRVKGWVRITIKSGDDLHWVTLESAESEFVIRELDTKDQSALGILAAVPELDRVISGRWGKLTQSMIDSLQNVSGQYPSLPHAESADYVLTRDLLQHRNDMDLTKCRAAVENYFNRHPRSALGDDLLFYLGHLEERFEPETVEGILRVIATFERIVKNCPDSPLVEEVQAELTKLRAKLAEASQTNSVSETSTTNSPPTSSP